MKIFGPEVKVGDTINFDGVEFSIAYVIPKVWKRKFKVKILEITDKDVTIEFPTPAEYYVRENNRSVLKRMWKLTILKHNWTAEDLEYLNSIDTCLDLKIS